MIQTEDLYQIGHIAKAHGLQGEVVFNFTDDIFDTTDADHLLLMIDGIPVPFFIREYRFRSESSALITFDGIESAEQARLIVGASVWFEKSEAAAADEETMSLRYFVDFKVVLAEGSPLGHIEDIDDNTDNWLFIVRRTDGSEVLIPAHEEFITAIDHETRVLTVDLPDGLLELS